MSKIDQRRALEELIESRREDYAGLSRLIGRNAAYIQQFIKRGTPRRLAERDIEVLARYFAVPAETLGGPPVLAASQLVRVPRRNVGASAGHGAFPGREEEAGHIAFEPSWLRALSSGDGKRLCIIKVQGDSMVPTLSDGDDILVDEGDGADRLRDGVYVLRVDDSLMVKRISLSPLGKAISIRSDNPSYPSFVSDDVSGLTVLGRVIWAGRRII